MVGDGITNIFSVPFPYINKTHVKVYTNSVEYPASLLHWPSAGQVQLNGGPSVYAGLLITVRRLTPVSPQLVVYTAGPLSPTSLNTDSLQALYAIEEMRTQAPWIGEGGAPTVYMSQVWQALGDTSNPGYDSTNKVRTSIPDAIPYSKEFVALSGTFMSFNDVGYNHIRTTMGWSNSVMATFFASTFGYPVSPTPV